MSEGNQGMEREREDEPFGERGQSFHLLKNEDYGEESMNTTRYISPSRK